MTQQNSAHPWLAAYLFYAEPWEQFLVDAVAPFARATLEGAAAEQFFFIRYWEEGPHIRLRFKGTQDRLENRVRQPLIQHFEGYFSQHPSEHKKALLEESRPNNSLHFVDYEPELERYGGTFGCEISERQFHASSVAVLNALAAPVESDYERRMGLAIDMHIGFARAVGMDRQELSLFFRHYFHQWLFRSYYRFRRDSEDDIERKRRTAVTGFCRAFESSEASLRPHFEQVWEAVDEPDSAELGWLGTWVHDMRKVHRELAEADRNGSLEIPTRFRGLDAESISPQRQRLWYLYVSYVHMTNNRLGIYNRDEAFLAYLLHGCASDRPIREPLPQ